MDSKYNRYYNRLLTKIIKASKGQRDAMYFAARRMNMIKDCLVIPTVITSAVMGSALMTSHVSDVPWMRWACASIAFANALVITIQKITRPGELGEIYQTYGRKWELFALNVLSMRKWQLKERESEIIHETGQLISKYNTMIEQSPLLPRWALSKFKASNEDLSSDEDNDDNVSIDNTSATQHPSFHGDRDTRGSRMSRMVQGNGIKKYSLTVKTDMQSEISDTEEPMEDITKEHALKGSDLEHYRSRMKTDKGDRHEGTILDLPSVHLFHH